MNTPVIRKRKHEIQYLRDGARRFYRSYHISGSPSALATAKDWWESANKKAEKLGLDRIPFLKLQREVSQEMPGEVVS